MVDRHEIQAEAQNPASSILLPVAVAAVFLVVLVVGAIVG